MFSATAAWARKRGLPCILGVALAASCAAVQAREPAQFSVSDVVPLSELPSEGRATHALILAGGPYPFEKDGVVFGNRERLLPASKRGYYREYTVKTSDVSHRGARRIVCGGFRTLPEACYYTADHYASFRRIGN